MNRRVVHGVIAAMLVLVARRAGATTPEEHASHHPGGAAAAAPGKPGVVPSAVMGAPGVPGTGTSGLVGGAALMGAPEAPGAASPPMGAPAAASGAPATGMAGGGMGAMMRDMMGGMATPGAPGSSGSKPSGCEGGDCGSAAAKTPIYPSLMTLPSLTPEKRAQIDALATQQLNEGTSRLAAGAASLDRATKASDNASMQQAIGAMREGLDEVGAGIAAHRVLSEGKSPRNLALDWFKREMNLASPAGRGELGNVPGVAPFHFFTMVLLVAFALTMVAMYFFKMRRAAALFGRLQAKSEQPPPGSSPPPAGAPPPGALPPPASPPAEGQQTSTEPVTANWRGVLGVGAIVAETPTVKTFRLVLPSGGNRMPFTFVPGQFLNVAFEIGGARMNRSYSISSSPAERKYVDLTIRREPRGAVSRHINDLLKVGGQLEASGPVGRFTFSGTEADSIVLIAGGVGITPMMSIARYLTEQSWAGEIFLVYACRAPIDFIFATELAALQRINPKLHLVVTMSRPEGTDWKGPRGHLTKELLVQTIPNIASRRIHLCGPQSMMDTAKTILTELGVSPDRIKTEAFGATRPIPAAAGTSPKPTAAATGPTVKFLKNNKSAKIHVGQTVLEFSEELGIGIENSCRVGTCGICKVKMTSGEVEMAVEDALEPTEKTNGIILACQAMPKDDIAVEA